VRLTDVLCGVKMCSHVCAVWCKGAFTREGLPVMTRYIAGIGIVYILALIVRGTVRREFFMCV